MRHGAGPIQTKRTTAAITKTMAAATATAAAKAPGEVSTI